MKRYPAFLDLHGRSCLVVGGGPVAERKAESLLAAGGVVIIVSPSLTPTLSMRAAAGAVTHRSKSFQLSDLNGVFLAIAATDDPAVNASVARACAERNILVNVATSPQLGTFIVPSVVSRDELQIAVSTGGASPALAKKIRSELEERYGPEYGRLLELMAQLRKRVEKEAPAEHVRRRIYQAVVESNVIELLRQGAVREVDRVIEEIVERERHSCSDKAI